LSTDGLIRQNKNEMSK